MSITDSLAIPELLRQHLIDPANVPLRNALLDALEGIGDEKQWEKIQTEWEPRAWLIAKGRIINSRGQFFYAAFHYRNEKLVWLGPVGTHWIPGMDDTKAETGEVLGNKLPPFYFWGGSPIEKCSIIDFCERWNKLDYDWKNWLWNWNPEKMKNEDE